MEETADTIYLVLPSSLGGRWGPAAGSPTGDLEAVAGGGWGDDDTSQAGTCTCGCPPP